MIDLVNKYYIYRMLREKDFELFDLSVNRRQVLLPKHTGTITSISEYHDPYDHYERTGKTTYFDDFNSNGQLVKRKVWETAYRGSYQYGYDADCYTDNYDDYNHDEDKEIEWTLDYHRNGTLYRVGGNGHGVYVVFEYDGNRRVVACDGSDGPVCFKYGSKGELTKATWENDDKKHRFSYIKSAPGMLTLDVFVDEQVLRKIASFTVDNKGNLVKWTRFRITKEYTYNTHNDVVRTIVSGPAFSQPRIEERRYVYDSSGNWISIEESHDGRLWETMSRQYFFDDL